MAATTSSAPLRGSLRDSKLAGKEAVYLCDGVVAEQRMLEAVAVSWSAAERYAARAEVIWLVVKTSWSGPVR